MLGRCQLTKNELDDSIRKAIGAHGAWKLKLKTALTTGRSELTPQIVGKDDQCEFGRWLYSQGVDAQTRAGMPYKVVKRLHGEFHQIAGRVLELSLSGKRDEATGLLEGDFTQKSETLARALAKWRGELQDNVA